MTTSSSSGIDATVKKYELLLPSVERYAIKLADLLTSLLRQSNIDYHVIEWRAKDPASLRAKLMRPREAYADPLKEVTDLCGIRIIVYYSDDIKRVSEIIEAEFSVDRANSSDKSTLLKAHEFGYRSLHYVVNMGSSRAALLEWRQFRELKAEIQIRTVMQHAWAAISHALQYKREQEIPQVLSRRLFRLAGLLELADEEFSAIERQRVKLDEDVSESLAVGELDLLVDGTSLRRYLKSDLISQIVEDALRAGFLLDLEKEGRKDAGDDSVSSLARLCGLLGIQTIKDLEETVVPTRDLQYGYFSLLMSRSRVGLDKWYVTRGFLVGSVLVLARCEIVTVEMLKQIGLPRSIGVYLIEAAREIREVKAS